MKSTLAFDSEVYPNYTLLLFKNVETKAVSTFELPLSTNHLGLLNSIIRQNRLITFNGIGYDIPLLSLVLRGDDSAKIKKASDRIIIHNLKWWHFEREFNVKCFPSWLDHVDLMEVAPLTGSLKAYAARMHSKSIQDLPIPPSTVVTEEQKDTLRQYCENDCDSLIDLAYALTEQLALREQMSATYGIDLRSKSDAQIAEAVIKKKVETRTKRTLERGGHTPGDKFRYHIPAWMSFVSLGILSTIREAWFVVGDNGRVLLPKELADSNIAIAGKPYQMGIGGLHSMEKKQIVKADDEHMLMDFDAQSFYPAILLNQRLYPKHVGQVFLHVYQDLVNRRLAAKAQASELKKEIANVKQMIYNLENEKKESYIS